MSQKAASNSKSFRLSRLLVLSERTYQRFLAPVLRENQVGMSDYPILLRLFHSQNAGFSALSQTEIAERNAQDAALVTRSVRSLSQKGLVTTAVDPSNKSRRLVSLTEEGYGKARCIDKAVRQWEEEAWARFGDDEPTARRLLGDLYELYAEKS